MRFLLVPVMLLLGACSLTPSGANPVDPTGTAEGVATSDPAQPAQATTPEFPEGLAWINADPLTMAELRGRVVLLDFWTHGCINCIHIQPDLHRLQEEFGDELVVIGIHSPKFAAEGRTESIRNVALRYGITHPIVNDADHELWSMYAARAWPTVFLIDQDGQIVGRHEGEGVYDVVQPHINRLVTGEPTTAAPLATAPIQKPTTVLSFPSAIALSPDGEELFVADLGHQQIVRIDRRSGEINAVVGRGERGYTDGPPSIARFDRPQGLVVDEAGETLYVADSGSHTVRAVDLATGVVSTVAGTGERGTWPPAGGVAREVGLHSPWGLTMVGERLYVAMAGTHQIWVLDVATGIIGVYAGSGRESVEGGPRLTAGLAQPSGMTTDGSRVWFADAESSSIRGVVDESVELVAGADDGLFSFGLADGVGNDARFQHPLDVVWDDGTLWVADTYNGAIRGVDVESGEVWTLAGRFAGWAEGEDPRFNEPGGLAVWGDTLYVADTNNHSIRTVDVASGSASTLALSGIERFRAADGVTELEPVLVTPGTVTLRLDVDLPDGYRVNTDAPSSIAWSGTAGLVDPAVVETVGPEFPMEFRVEAVSSGVITGDVAVVYCEEERASICLFERVKLRLPLELAEHGTSTLRVDHTVELPAGMP